MSFDIKDYYRNDIQPFNAHDRSSQIVPLALMGAALLIGCGTGTGSTSTSKEASAQIPSPSQASGNFAIVLTPIQVSSVDGNTIIDYSFHEVTSGAFDGARDGTGRLVSHADGTFEALDCGTYVGSFREVASGTAELCVVALGAGASIHGTFILGNGGGGLTGIQGGGDFEGSATASLAFSGTYSGQVLFQ